MTGNAHQRVSFPIQRQLFGRRTNLRAKDSWTLIPFPCLKSTLAYELDLAGQAVEIPPIAMVWGANLLAPVTARASGRRATGHNRLPKLHEQHLRHPSAA